MAPRGGPPRRAAEERREPSRRRISHRKPPSHPGGVSSAQRKELTEQRVTQWRVQQRAVRSAEHLQSSAAE